MIKRQADVIPPVLQYHIIYKKYVKRCMQYLNIVYKKSILYDIFFYLLLAVFERFTASPTFDTCPFKI